MNTYNVTELVSTFLKIHNELVELLYTQVNDFLNESIRTKTNELKDLRTSILKSIPQNEIDEMYDEIHDIILCDGDFDGKMPQGYKAIIFNSEYSSIMGMYYTYAIVETPNNSQYIITINTFGYMPIGKVFE